MQKIGADQLTLRPVEDGVRGESVFHFVGARFKYLEQVPVPALEILQDVGELAGRRLRIKRQNAVDDMVRSRLVGGIEITRLHGRPA